MRTNRFNANCDGCGRPVLAGAGHLVMKTGRRRRPFYDVLCQECHDKNDHSSAEDRCCGDAAYEDACAAACGVGEAPAPYDATAQAARDAEEGRLIRNAVQGFDPNHPDADSRLSDVIAACVALGRLSDGKRDCPWLTPLESARQSVKFILEQVAVIARELPPADPKPVTPNT